MRFQWRKKKRPGRVPAFLQTIWFDTRGNAEHPDHLNTYGIAIHVATGPLDIIPGSNFEFMTALMTDSSNT